ncbi:MAG: ribonuclease H family protein [Acidimicrobiales bacterium]
MSHQPQWAVYSDGGCAPHNPGPAAWGALIETPTGETLERNGFIGHGTNQIAELTGAIEGLKVTPAGAEVLLVSDSQYVIKGLTEWRRGWERRGWRNSQGDPVANASLWRALFALADERRVQARWVRGHAGHPQNERADRLAGEALRAEARGARGAQAVDVASGE